MLDYLFLHFLALSNLAFGATSNDLKLPECSATSGPCRCPHGTTFKNLTSFSIIGAAATEVRKIMDGFFQSEWLGGSIPYKTTGNEGVVGATRAYNYSNPEGYYIFKEVLTKQITYPDGSFVQGFAQSAEPSIIMVPGGGEFHGEWAEIMAQQTLVNNETALSWNNWRCDVGTPYDAATGHESAMMNVSSIISKGGKLSGVDVKPFTIFYTVRND